MGLLAPPARVKLRASPPATKNPSERTFAVRHEVYDEF